MLALGVEVWFSTLPNLGVSFLTQEKFSTGLKISFALVLKLKESFLEAPSRGLRPRGKKKSLDISILVESSAVKVGCFDFFVKEGGVNI